MKPRKKKKENKKGKHTQKKRFMQREREEIAKTFESFFFSYLFASFPFVRLRIDVVFFACAGCVLNVGSPLSGV